MARCRRRRAAHCARPGRRWWQANSTTTTNVVVTLRSGLPLVAEHPPEQREGGIHPDQLQRPEHAEEPRDSARARRRQGGGGSAPPRARSMIAGALAAHFTRSSARKSVMPYCAAKISATRRQKSVSARSLPGGRPGMVPARNAAIPAIASSRSESAMARCSRESSARMVPSGFLEEEFSAPTIPRARAGESSHYPPHSSACHRILASGVEGRVTHPDWALMRSARPQGTSLRRPCQRSARSSARGFALRRPPREGRAVARATAVRGKQTMQRP